MEKKVMEKIDRAVAEITELEKDINARWNVFYKEFCTADIKKMLKTIISHGGGFLYYYSLNDDSRIAIDSRSWNICIENMSGGVITRIAIANLVNDAFKTYQYCDRMIEILEGRARNINMSNKYFSILQDQIGSIIESITEEYKRITEVQSDKLDKVLSMLDIPNEPTKHIKVTVEWI